MKEFLFMYPVSDYINWEIRNGSWLSKTKIPYRRFYKEMINKTINQRYRENGFGINFAIFNNGSISNIIDLQKSDKVVEVGLDFETHCSKKIYPKSNFIMESLGLTPQNTEHLRIAGFHMWDCVEKIAKKAYEQGFDTLVDEDLTEFFSGRLRDQNFRTNRYPTFRPRELNGEQFRSFMEARKERPWLWQEY